MADDLQANLQNYVLQLQQVFMSNFIIFSSKFFKCIS